MFSLLVKELSKDYLEENEDIPNESQWLRLTQSFPVTFYATGPTERLRTRWRYLAAQDDPPVFCTAVHLSE